MEVVDVTTGVEITDRKLLKKQLLEQKEVELATETRVKVTTETWGFETRNEVQNLKKQI